MFDEMGKVLFVFAALWAYGLHRHKENIKAAANSPLGQAAKKKGMEWLIGRLFKR